MGVTPESFIDKMKQLGVSILGVNCTLSVEDMDVLLKKCMSMIKKHPF
jgi:5-methyltetrahydrofolate--homocysteine methyltransferase